MGFCSSRIGPDRIAYLVHCPDWAGLDPTHAGLGPDWIPENESVSYSGGRPQLGEVGKGTGRAQLCVYVKHSTLNSVIEQELRDRRVEDRATGERNKLCLVGALSLGIPPFKRFGRNVHKKCQGTPISNFLNTFYSFKI